MCRLLTFGFPYDVTEIERPDGKNYRLLFAGNGNQSSDAIIYVTVRFATRVLRNQVSSGGR